MPHRLPPWCLLFFPLAVLHAGSRESALQAQALVGAEIPTRLVRLMNPSAPDWRYAREFYGLVLTVGGIEWLYTEHEGTQNLSSRRGEVAPDSAALARLLRTAGLPLSAEEKVTPGERIPRGTPPPNGCFPVCLGRWLQLQAERDPPPRGRLLACFAPDEGRGHVLLEYFRGGRRWVFDPDRPDKLIRIPAQVSDDPLAVAALALRSRWRSAPVRAVPVPLTPERLDPQVAAVPGVSPGRS